MLIVEASELINERLLALGVAVALGLLVGLQRETTDDRVAGLRTFTLITALGCVLSLLDGQTGAWWLSLGGLLSIAAIAVLGNVAQWRSDQTSPGMTTEVAMLLMFAVGVLVGAGVRVPAIVLAGTVAILLHWKEPLHGLVDRIGAHELKALFNLVLIALVILPILPDRTFGPYDVLNPSNIWRMVVLISGISLSAYVVHRWLGATRGAIVAGVLGGLISSTATTVSFARQAKDAPKTAWAVSLVLIIASTIVNVRILVEIGIVDRELLMRSLPPMAALTALMIALCIYAWVRARGEEAAQVDYENPGQLKAALVFGALYALVLLIVAAVSDAFGEGALYLVALVSGLTDVDAITLSTARLHGTGAASTETSWRVIMVALASNLAFKTGVVATLGGVPLLRRCGALFLVTILGVVAIVLLWPDGAGWLGTLDRSPSN